jgi:hypothetical protein
MSFVKALARGFGIVVAVGSLARGDALFSASMNPGGSSGASGSGNANLVGPLWTGGQNLDSGDATNQVSNSAPSAFWNVTATGSSASAAPAPAASPAPASTASYAAFVNMGSAPYANTADLTSGSPQPWYSSSAVAQVYGGTPNAQQQASFEATVLARVQQTFNLGGVPITLTGDPSQSSAHMLSVVSQSVNPAMPGAVGMTNVGGNGFDFIDNAAKAAQSVDQLEWIVAHNVAHELMLAFGVPEKNDQTGQFIDSTVANWNMMVNPNATFSPGAIHDLLNANFLASNTGSGSPSAQLIDGAPVPEPTTVALWVVGAAGALVVRRSRAKSTKA